MSAFLEALPPSLPLSAGCSGSGRRPAAVRAYACGAVEWFAARQRTAFCNFAHVRDGNSEHKFNIRGSAVGTAGTAITATANIWSSAPAPPPSPPPLRRAVVRYFRDAPVRLLREQMFRTSKNRAASHSTHFVIYIPGFGQSYGRCLSARCSRAKV